MSEHKLKCWPRLFEETVQMQKRFEYRKSEYGFRVNDTILLMEYDGMAESYTGRTVRVVVTGVWGAGIIKGLADGYVLLGITPIQSVETMKRGDGW